MITYQKYAIKHIFSTPHLQHLSAPAYISLQTKNLLRIDSGVNGRSEK